MIFVHVCHYVQTKYIHTLICMCNTSLLMSSKEFYNCLISFFKKINKKKKEMIFTCRNNLLILKMNSFCIELNVKKTLIK